MKFFDVLTVLGALIGAGTALDFSVRKSAKQQFTAWLTRVVAADSNYSYNGTVFLDRIFGKGWACADFCVNGIVLKLRNAAFELDGKAVERRLPIMDGKRPFFTDVA